MTVLARQLLLASLLAVAAGSSTAQPVRPGDEPRIEAYEEFRSLFAAERFTEALPLAERVVQMTESAGPGHDELPVAYNNLGVVQLRTGDIDGAERSFGHALELLEGRVGIASRRLIAPLTGLGSVHAARGHHARAAEVLQRALAVARRANGLFSIDQLELLESLVESYQAVGNQAGVERERRYAVQVVQQEYGYDDPRTLPALVQLADLYERSDRHPLARAQWQRVVEVSSREGDGRNAATVLGLLGIARGHRLQYARDPESLEEAQKPIDPWSNRPYPVVTELEQGPVKVNREGEAAALRALEILDEAPDPPRRLLARALTELGDWYATAGRMDKAVPYYRRAWPLFEETREHGEPNPLATPRPLIYRPHPASIRNRDRTDVEVVAQPIEFAMQVSAGGTTDAVSVVSGDAGDPGQTGEFRAGLLRRALQRARFSPRFEDGLPVATESYRFVAVWYDAVAEPATAPQAEPPAAGAPPS